MILHTPGYEPGELPIARHPVIFFLEHRQSYDQNDNATTGKEMEVTQNET